MKNKNNFANFITEKRKLAQLTQKQLADFIHVSESAVSKWERGISYPDISLISSLCEVLSITEHEFITASDDVKMRTDQRRLSRMDRFQKWMILTSIVFYCLTVLISFFCNLFFDHHLTWSLVTFVCITMSFSLFPLPFFLKKNKVPICFGFFSLLSYLLLLMIKITTDVTWSFLQGATVLTVWLLIAGIIYIIAIKMNDWLLKGSFLFILLGFFVLLINPVIEWILNQKPFTIKDNPAGNTPTALLFLGIAFILLLLKMIKGTKNKRI